MKKELEKLDKDVKICGIYKIISPSNRVYIGQSIDCIKRIKDYQSYDKTGDQRRLKSSFAKYGKDNHIFEIIEKCSISELNEKERYWQDYYNVLSNKGLNCKLTNTTDKSGKLSKITKNKIAKSNKGKEHSEETKKKISKKNTGKKRPNSGKAISEANKKRYEDENERMKHSIKLRKKVYQYSKEGIFMKEYVSVREAERQTGIFAASIVSAIKGKRYSKSAKGYLWSYNKLEIHSGHIGPVGKKVEQYTLENVFIQEFDSICDTAKQLNICKSGIIRCCKGKQKQCGGFIFKYKKNENI